MTELKLTTWGCGICGYHMPATIDPYSDAFVAKYPGVKPGCCPSCATNPNPSARQDSLLSQITDLSQLATTTTADDATLEAEQVPDLDANGQPIMVASGQMRYQFDPATGQINPVPVMVQQMRNLTDAELAALKLQRDQNLDALAPIAVSETTEGSA